LFFAIFFWVTGILVFLPAIEPNASFASIFASFVLNSLCYVGEVGFWMPRPQYFRDSQLTATCAA
jgi:ABC-type amino acid transport system permease subunit